MPRSTEPELAEALAQCASEPVHIPGAIQPGGCLISTDPALIRILQVSANVQTFLGVAATEALAATPADLLGARLLGRIRRALPLHEPGPVSLALRRVVNDHNSRLRVTAYRSAGRVVMEFEPDSPARARNLLPKIRDILSSIAEAEDPDSLLDWLVDGIRRVTGHDRAVVCAFDADGHGTVIAERRADGVVSLLGHSFPASDIPPQVRRLYAISPVRAIPNAAADKVALIPRLDPEGGEPLDLSLGSLRAVSPIHVRYMKNMGLSASMSIAIHDNDMLWGLAASHGVQPAPLPPAVRDVALVLVQMASQRLFLLKARADSRYRQRALDSRALIATDRRGLLDPAQLVQQHGPEWLALFEAQGIALVSRDLITGWGTRPSDEDLGRVATRLAQQHGDHRVWAGQALSDTALADAAEWGTCCGMLAVPLPMHDRHPGWLMLFRAERVTTRRWAGKLELAPPAQTGSRALSPTRSFEMWLEEVRGRCAPWLPLERQAAMDLADDLAIAISVREVAQLNARLTSANEGLERLAHVDALTQLWNRYATEQAIDREIHAAGRYARPCSLLLLDVDNFKGINDAHGHAVGDDVLSRLAQEIGGALRISDHAGRWGGEEFVVLATNSDIAAAAHLAEQLRLKVAAGDFAAAGRVTISVGVAAWRDGDTRRSLVERADQALYRAKQGGRNRVALEPDA